MKNLEVVKGIGEVNRDGDVLRTCLYAGEKGYKVVEIGEKKIVYLLTTQEKIFAVSTNDKVEIHPKGVLISKDGLNGVFDMSGKCLGWFDTVRMDLLN